MDTITVLEVVAGGITFIGVSLVALHFTFNKKQQNQKVGNNNSGSVNQYGDGATINNNPTTIHIPQPPITVANISGVPLRHDSILILHDLYQAQKQNPGAAARLKSTQDTAIFLNELENCGALEKNYDTGLYKLGTHGSAIITDYLPIDDYKKSRTAILKVVNEYAKHSNRKFGNGNSCLIRQEDQYTLIILRNLKHERLIDFNGERSPGEGCLYAMIQQWQYKSLDEEYNKSL